MWNFFSCYLSGRHDYGMWCEPGAIFLRCVHCGKRSSGWTVAPKPQPVPVVRAINAAPSRQPGRMLRFGRAAAQ
jgi:hypothetical protein